MSSVTYSSASGLLTLTWALPLASAGVLALMPRDGVAGIRRFALAANTINLALVAFLSVLFFRSPPAPVAGSTETVLAFAADHAWFPALNIRYLVGVDAISLSLMLLAAVIMFSGTLASWNIGNTGKNAAAGSGAKTFFILLQILAAGVFGCFISFDLFTFFVFNELTLIPTYLLIALFGSGRREYAAMKLTLILMGGSALILLGIFGLYFESGIQSFSILELSQVRFAPGFQLWAFPVIFLGFGILGNMFPFHIWSPDGHASAPTAVSMLLAGVHMKLGAYGCLRVALYLLPEGAAAWMGVFLIPAGAGVVWGGFVAVRQKDLKYMNAYSSVSHCGLVFVGLATLNLIGLRGAVMQMLAHGFITATVFAVIGMIYQRTHTRHIPDMSGLMRTIPFLAVAFVIAGLAALGLPGLAGFAAELNIFLGAFAASGAIWRTGAVLAVLSIIVSAIYILRAVNAVLHGPAKENAPGISDAVPVEKIALVTLLAAVVVLGLWPGPVIGLLDDALLPILNNLNR
jgi:NADH-quinone oxidoreductase subunit M